MERSAAVAVMETLLFMIVVVGLTNHGLRNRV